MLIVNGAVVARPESFETLLEASLDHAERSRLEPGCLGHQVCLDCENPLRLVFLEHWSDRSSLDAHFLRPASAMFADAMRSLAASTAPLRIFDLGGASEELVAIATHS